MQSKAWAVRQLEEIDSLRATFFEEDAVRVDEAALAALRRFASPSVSGDEAAGAPAPGTPLSLSVRLDGTQPSRPVGVLRLAAVLPHGYPEDGQDAPPAFWLEPELEGQADLERDAEAAVVAGLAEDEDLCSQLQETAAGLAAAGEEAVLPVALLAIELIRERLCQFGQLTPTSGEGADGAEIGLSEEADEALAYALFEEELMSMDHRRAGPAPQPRLGRRAMFSHHIIAPSKREAIRQWAVQLRLGGLAKIGWPGLIIVEGDEQHVQLYVDALSRLRWKHFVIRGEQIVEGRAGQHLDELRLLPLAFEEFGTDGMGEFAARCRQYNVEDLFFACMKMSAPSSAKQKGAKAAKVDDAGDPSAATSAARKGRRR